MKKPLKRKKISLQTSVGEETVKAFKELAAKEGRSPAGQLRFLIVNAIKEESEKVK